MPKTITNFDQNAIASGDGNNLTPDDITLIERYKARRKKFKGSLKISGNKIDYDRPGSEVGVLEIMESVGANNMAFLSPFVGQIVNAASVGPEIQETETNFALAVVKGIEPRDQLEAMLAAQMAAVHKATMMMARRLNHAENIDQQNAAERAFNKLSRTYVKQMEGLKRYRTGGEQKVTVEHVTVNEGGQAIVGNGNHEGKRLPREVKKKPETTA